MTVPDAATSLQQLHQAYAGPLFVYALRRLHDRQAAEEVVQDTLVRAWRHADRFDPQRASVSTWLFTIAHNVVVDRLRRDGARPRPVANLDAVDVVAADEVERVLEAWQVAEALAGLTAAHRDVIVAAYYRGQSVAEVAAALGVPEGTVKSRLFYGLRALRLRLEEMGVVR